jgi:MFS family permease
VLPGLGWPCLPNAAGAIIGAIFADRLSHRLGIGRLVLWAMILACTIMLAIAFVPAGVALTLPLLMVILGLNGFGIAIASIAAVSIRQAVTPSRLLGRMTASYRFVSYGMVALGALVGGFAGELLGLRFGLFVGAVGMLGAIGWVAVSPLRYLASVDEAVAGVTAR